MEQHETLHFHKLTKPRRRWTLSKRIRKITLSVVLVVVAVCAIAAFVYMDDFQGHVADLVQLVQTKCFGVQRAP